MQTAALAFLITASSGLASPTDLWIGHFEVQIDYDETAPTPDQGWSSSISYDLDGSFADDTGVVRLNPDDYRLVVTPSSKLSIPASFPELGDAGDPIWILQQTNQAGQLFLGRRAIFAPSIFQAEVDGVYSPSPLGSMASSLSSISGSGPDRGGHFFMWTSGGFGQREFHYNSSDGIDQNDRLSPIQAGSHQHYNWGFSQPGNYLITFLNSGRLNPQFGGSDTSASEQFQFVVPFSGAIPNGSEIRLAPSGTAAWYDATLDVEISTGQSALILSGVQENAAFTLGAGLSPPSDRVGLAGQSPIGVSLPDSLSLVSQVGPGQVSLISQGSHQYELSLALPGIYRLGLQGNYANQSGEIIEIVVLVGLGMDYNYAQWADSFEKSAGVATGALAAYQDDFDGDGLPNGAEFCLFWHGLNPCLPDADKAPKAEYRDGAARLVFLRDFYKNDLFSGELELAAAQAPKPDGPWQAWRAIFSEGTPDGFIEAGRPNGSAVGAISRRELTVPDSNPDLGFFQFQVTPRN